MCGIIGITHKDKNVTNDIFKALRSLQYRGYDSYGVGYLENGKFNLFKSLNRIAKEPPKEISSNIMIGHTRWATHGIISLNNAHPFVSLNKKVLLVHNGIIENYEEIKSFLLSKSYSFTSQTDSEVICNLIDYLYLQNLTILEIIKLLIKHLKGTYAFLIMLENDKRIYFLKNESPLIIGLGTNFNLLTSDILSVSYLVNKFLNLDNYDYGYITSSDYKIYSKTPKEIINISSKTSTFSKGKFKHYMLKEINDEESLIDSILTLYFFNKKIHLSDELINDIINHKYIYFVGCGSSYNASLILKDIYEKKLKKEVYVILASEIKNLNILHEDSLFIFLSQSGETIDLKLALNYLPNDNVYLFTSSPYSSLSLLAKKAFFLGCNSEVAVASTKAYLAELITPLLPVYKILNEDEYFYNYLVNLKSNIKKILTQSNLVYKDALDIYKYEHLYFIGRGTDYYLALEASLKIKEVSYIHSDEFYGGELKHGSIALLDDKSLVVAISLNKNEESLINSNIKEVESRKCKTFVISTSSLKSKFNLNLKDNNLYPLDVITYFQLLAYYLALLKKCDIDKPRNLAKSVTVI